MAAVAIIDIGKTHSKFSVLGRDGSLLSTSQRANCSRTQDGRAVLDADAIEVWMLDRLAEAADTHRIGAIVPVAHGATAAFVSESGLAAPVLDYEADPPPAVVRAYEAERDDFALTLSPRLPHGLNLGVQLAWQEEEVPALRRSSICLWPQYWSWRLCGMRAAEVTSLGCHTDLWYPAQARFGAMAERRGWAERMGPLTKASAIVGALRSKLATKLSSDCAIHCGIHDSNAALLAARLHREVSDKSFTLVSTGTWFVAMQSGVFDLPLLDEARDMLANVDVDGRAVPSARFMGGREFEAIAGLGASATEDAARRIVDCGALALPSFARGTGPFPRVTGAILGKADSASERAALAELYLALMTDAVLGSISAEGPVLLEGRFASHAIFAAALAALRRLSPVYAMPSGDGLAMGALSLAEPNLVPAAPLNRISPFDADLARYRDLWRAAVSKESDRIEVR